MSSSAIPQSSAVPAPSRAVLPANQASEPIVGTGVQPPYASASARSTT
ncbi:hypothetical protein ACFQQB_05035 [Nonomuraea rubra]